MSSLQIAFLNVGQGDTNVIFDPETGEAVVVDCFDAISVFDFMESNSLSHLRALILTHPHVDHYLGAIDLLDNCERRGINWDALVFRWDKDYRKMPELLSDVDKHSEMNIDARRKKSIYQSLLTFSIQEENKERHKEWHQISKDTHLLQGITILHPEHKDQFELFQTGQLNNLSYVLRVSDGTSALLTGDIEPEGWIFLKKNHPDLLGSFILKFPHHGVWRNANASELLDEVNPEIVVISVGTGNTYGHPSPDVFTEIRKRRKIHLLCTQATSNCSNVLEKSRLEIIALLKKDNHNLATINDNSLGCPCAGTIVIELGGKAKVLWPNSDIHKNIIIKNYMLNHQCLKKEIKNLTS